MYIFTRNFLPWVKLFCSLYSNWIMYDARCSHRVVIWSYWSTSGRLLKTSFSSRTSAD